MPLLREDDRRIRVAEQGRLRRKRSLNLAPPSGGEAREELVRPRRLEPNSVTVSGGGGLVPPREFYGRPPAAAACGVTAKSFDQLNADKSLSAESTSFQVGGVASRAWRMSSVRLATWVLFKSRKHGQWPIYLITMPIQVIT